jgi:predicted nuclease of predicted toxin-antitoxin system
MPIRFHLDESMPNAVADGLRRRGVDVTTSSDAGLLGASDEDQLNFARGVGRVTITRDQDFLRLDARGVDHVGIIYWTERQRTIGQLIGALASMIVDYGEEDVRGRVLFY